MKPGHCATILRGDELPLEENPAMKESQWIELSVPQTLLRGDIKRHRPSLLMLNRGRDIWPQLPPDTDPVTESHRGQGAGFCSDRCMALKLGSLSLCFFIVNPKGKWNYIRSLGEHARHFCQAHTKCSERAEHPQFCSPSAWMRSRVPHLKL